MTGEPCEIGVLFADITASTRLYEEHGDEASLAAINACFRVLGHAVAENSGVVVRTLGDEVMATFASPADMVSAATAMQLSICALDPVCSEGGSSTKLAVRVGFHFGSAIEDHADFYGDTVNVAARMSSLARAGQIITTTQVRDLLPPGQRTNLRDLGPVRVKGKALPVDAVEVLWHDLRDVTVLDARPVATAAAHRGIKLWNAERAWIFDGERPAITLGREVSSDVVIDDLRASRNHATIERRHDRWILTDHSTNGTFVTFQDEGEIRLAREEMILYRPGIVSFGQPAGISGPALRFTFL
jgi:class 3 adenylate cyclase